VRRLLLITCVTLLLVPVPALTADQETETSKLKRIGGLKFVDELEVTVVNVVAYVTDKKGSPIEGLTMEDFKLYQDGQEKPVTNFQAFTQELYQSNLELPALDRPIPRTEETGEEIPRPKPVHIVLYIDNENLHPIHRNRVLSQARDFVRANLVPPVEMMVVAYQRSFEIVQPFTSDSMPVLQALRSLRKYTGGFPERRSSREEIIEMMERQIDEQGGRAGYNARSTREYQTVYQSIVAYAEEEFTNLAFTVDALRNVMSMIAGLPGRKVIIYVSNGLPMQPGLGLFTALSETYQDHGLLSEISRFDRTPLFKSLTSVASAQDISFYTIGAGGLEVSGFGSAEYRSPRSPMASSLSMNNYLDSLRYMADSTGGFAIVNTNDFSVGLEKVAKDIYTYYSLGYTLNMSGSDKVHRVRIELPDHEDYRIRYRKRVVEKSLETRVQDKVLTGLMFDLEDNPMQVDFEAGRPSPASNDRWLVPISISFPLRKVALLPEGEDYVGQVTVFIAARDTKGKQSDLVRQEHQVRVPANEYEDAQRQRYVITSSLLMDAGSFRVALGVLDQVTRQSSFQALRTTIADS
jgi:VWFA-related protein